MFISLPLLAGSAAYLRSAVSDFRVSRYHLFPKPVELTLIEESKHAEEQGRAAGPALFDKLGLPHRDNTPVNNGWRRAAPPTYKRHMRSRLVFVAELASVLACPCRNGGVVWGSSFGTLASYDEECFFSGAVSLCPTLWYSGVLVERHFYMLCEHGNVSACNAGGGGGREVAAARSLRRLKAYPEQTSSMY